VSDAQGVVLAIGQVALLPELVRLWAFVDWSGAAFVQGKMHRKKRRRDCLGVRALARLMRRFRNFGTLFHEAFASELTALSQYCRLSHI
jgi:hypothetical protein